MEMPMSLKSLQGLTLEDLPPGILEDLLRSAEKSEDRQYKRLKQLLRQAELSRQRSEALRLKEEAEFERERRRSIEYQLEATERAKRMYSLGNIVSDLSRLCSSEAEEKRVQTIAQAQKNRDNDLAALFRKLEESKRRSERFEQRKVEEWLIDKSTSRQKQEKRDQVKKWSEILLEQRRLELFQKQQDINERISRRHQLLEHKKNIEMYKKHLSEIDRQKIVMEKAIQQEENRQQAILQSQIRKQLSLEKVQKENEERNAARTARLKENEEFAKQKVDEVRQTGEERRRQQHLAFEDKISKAVMISKKRQKVLEALAEIRRELLRQEEELRVKIQEGDLEALDEVDLSAPTRLFSSLKSTLRPQSAGRESQLSFTFPSSLTETLLLGDDDLETQIAMNCEEVEQELSQI